MARCSTRLDEGLIGNRNINRNLALRNTGAFYSGAGLGQPVDEALNGTILIIRRQDGALRSDDICLRVTPCPAYSRLPAQYGGESLSPVHHLMPTLQPAAFPDSHGTYFSLQLIGRMAEKEHCLLTLSRNGKIRAWRSSHHATSLDRAFTQAHQIQPERALTGAAGLALLRP